MEAILTELRCHQTTGLGGILAGEGLWLHIRGHQSIFRSEIGYTTEGSTIANGRFEEETHTLVVDGFLTCIDDALQHEVGLLELIPEEQIGL